MLNWMVREATAYQFVATRDYLITRMLFLSRLKNVPVTKEAVSYADHFSNETNYTIGKKGARPLALIYNHIGMPDKAKYWALRSDEPDEIEISEHPLVTNGLISGRIILNEKPFRGRVALFNTEEEEVLFLGSSGLRILLMPPIWKMAYSPLRILAKANTSSQ